MTKQCSSPFHNMKIFQLTSDDSSLEYLLLCSDDFVVLVFELLLEFDSFFVGGLRPPRLLVPLLPLTAVSSSTASEKSSLNCFWKSTEVLPLMS